MGIIEKIIEDLLSHEISKKETIDKLKNIVNKNRKHNTIEFNVESLGFTTDTNTAVLRLNLPYGYDKVKGVIEKGNKVDVSIIY